MPAQQQALNVVGKQKILTVENYQLEKWIWTDTDFDVMGWHDSYIYAFKIDDNIYFDIDYIFKWVQPSQDDWFSFWVAPCTLIFEIPEKFSFHLESNEFNNQIEIADLHRQVNGKGKTEWRIETHIGDILIESENFRQIVRRRPTLQTGQQIIPEERGEVSFVTLSDKNFFETEQVKLIKDKLFILRQKATKAKHLEKELSDLFDKRLKMEIDTKQYILSKRILEQKIKGIKLELEQNEF